MKFYNREREIRLVEKARKGLKIAVVGRRRIGKTRLVEEALKGDIITLFIPAEKSEQEIIRDWSREYEEIPQVKTFKEVFEFLFRHFKEKVVFIDEIQNVLKVNKSFVFDLQRLIDKHKPNLVVTGSLIRTMKNLIENYRSPLFERFDMIIKLRELEFPVICEICSDMGFGMEDAIKFYSVFGGIPKYYELIEKMGKMDFCSFLKEMFILYPRPLYEEVKTTLKEEFGKEYKMFFSILSAVSQGYTKLGEISSFVGREETKLTKYVSLLVNDFEILKRETPVIGSKKRGVYAFSSNLFEFWFRNVWRYAELIETGNEEKVCALLEKNLNAWVGRKFENIVLELIKNGVVLKQFSFTNIGKQWGKIPKEFKPEKGRDTYEIDIVALNEQTKEILFAECKWQEKVNAKKICKELAEKAQYVKWHNAERRESFAIFAKSFSKRISEFEGKRVYCFDLKDLKKFLKRKK